MNKKRSLFSTFARCLAVFLAPLTTIGCSDGAFSGRRLSALEADVFAFFNGNKKVFEISKVDGGQQIAAFCVLEPYHDQLPPHDEQLVPTNSFLKEHGFVGEETKWHLIIQTQEGLFVARFDVDDVPLALPKPLFAEKHNCVQSSVIKLSKQVDSKNRVRIHIYPGE